MWFERRAGSEESLLVLYDAVRAAEELDLEEEVRAERLTAELRSLDRWPPEADDRGADPIDAPDPTVGDRITMPQAIGIIEHLLGGQSMP